jgi:predicted dinucleotide-binding enzyme
MKIVIVGVGGVGTRLARELPMYVSRAHAGSEIVLIDGDIFEEKNLDRQDFDAERGIGTNKAAMWADEIKKRYPKLAVTYHDQFVTTANVAEMIPEGATVFCAVDNHASRKLLSDHVSVMRDGTLISGGNDYHDGNVQVHVRKEGEDVTPPITYLHPEIEHPADKNPAEMSCEERAASGSPQLQFANVKVATEMMSTFYAVTTEDPRFSEVYFDLKRGTQRPIMRKRKEVKHGDAEAVHDDSALAGDAGRVRAEV